MIAITRNNTRNRGATIGAAGLALLAISVAQDASAQEKDAHVASIAGFPATEIANIAVAELMNARAQGEIRSGADQPKLLAPYLAAVRYDPAAPPENEHDIASLAELHFLNFRPREAEALYAHLLERDDLLGRLAWQRVMQIRKQAFDRPEEVRAMLAEFGARFDHDYADVFGSTQQVANFAREHFAAGDADAAVDLLVAHIEATPVTGPYRAFSVFRFFPEEIAASGRSDDVRRALAEKLGGLRQTHAGWAAAKGCIDAREELSVRAQVPGWFWTQQRVAADQTIHDARLAQLAQLIDQLEAYLS